jgi:hypothetical protein
MRASCGSSTGSFTGAARVLNAQGDGDQARQLLESHLRTALLTAPRGG